MLEEKVGCYSFQLDLKHRKRTGNIYSEMLILLFGANKSMGMLLPVSVFPFQIFYNWYNLE